ncbi:hypothetical protein [Alteribacter aurantiacus]|uniref:hypothetical protein n=1 Tax=Alteribacter aurantiacus TaxID=254410 RepID=UPI00041F2684|nr:hypothetical protein [Alteribacter aurantiacus]
MEGLINLLLNNPLLLLFAIFGLISLFGGAGAAKKGDQNQRQRPQQRQQGGQPAKEERDIDWKQIFGVEEEEQYDRKQPRAESDTYKAPRSLGESEPKPDQYAADQQGRRELAQTNDDLNDRYEEMKRRKQEAKRRSSKIDDESPIFQKDITRKEKVELDFSSISREDAVKGVVWSEILGPPRSRNPRRQNSYGRRRG